MSLDALWLYPAYLLAGFFGAVCYAFRVNGWKQICSALVTGTLMANYGSILVEKWLGPGTTTALAAFMTGFLSTVLLDGFIRKAEKWTSTNGTRGPMR
jgi:hypothetical protein